MSKSTEDRITAALGFTPLKGQLHSYVKLVESFHDRTKLACILRLSSRTGASRVVFTVAIGQIQVTGSGDVRDVESAMNVALVMFEKEQLLASSSKEDAEA